MKSSSESSPRLLDRFLARIESVPGSDRLLLRIAFFVVIASTIWLIFSFNQAHSVITPVRGGSITEGIIGTPRFANPALALTRADQDVTALVYSGLMKIDLDGSLVNDTAASIITSEDGLTYTITLRNDVVFHDNTPLTAKDVVYTIQLIQNPDLKSPLRGNWTDVVVTEVNEFELTITLLEPYAPFIENFTLGIMPAHIWSKLPVDQLPFSQLNTEPIGSGPFSVTSAKRDASGLISHYTLSGHLANNSDPKISTLELSFFQNEAELLGAIAEGAVDATTYVSNENIPPLLTSEDFQLIEVPLPRTFGIFFNQNKAAALRDESAREALTTVIDRDVLIEKAVSGYGIPITGPIPNLTSGIESTEGKESESTEARQARAVKILEAGGWLKNNVGQYEKQIDGATVTLSLTLRTSNTPLFQVLVKAVVEQWEAIGVEVTTEQFEQTGLVQSVIRPRDFQALLFGLDMSRTYDLYPFWHSSQQDDPGLNIAQYANVSVDALLQSARTEQDIEVRNQSLAEAGEIISKEMPAIFLFQPNLTYLVSTEVTVAPIKNLGRSSDRFAGIDQWHTESDSLWQIFRQDM